MGKIKLVLLTENIFTDFFLISPLNVLYFAIFRNNFFYLDFFSLSLNKKLFFKFVMRLHN